MYKVSTILVIAIQNLLGNKLRSILTILGIIIGVASVITMLSVGQGAQEAIDAQLQSLGTNLLFVIPGSATVGGLRGEAGGSGILTLEDANALMNPLNLPVVAAVAPSWDLVAQVTYRGATVRTRIFGVTPSFEQVRNTPVVAGEFIRDSHVVGQANVALLGSVVAGNLFGAEDPLGKWIRINNIPFQVIGLLKPKGATGFINHDDLIFIPITTAQRRLGADLPNRPINSVTVINIQVISQDQLEAAVAQISAVLRRRHRILYEDDFAIVGQDEVAGTAQQVIRVFSFFLGGVASISLIVGGIGVMNIMLVTVTERTREIGIRKALGAKRSDIMVQFLVETLVLTLLGGVLGLALGIGITLAAAQIDLGGLTLDPSLGLDSILLALGFSAATGFLFGLYPARRAAAMRPIEALRYE